MAYPVVILDRMLPAPDGLEVCRTLRDEGCASLILMLTAMDRLDDKVDGLRGGADDYLTKPFAFDELLARVGAMMRRAPAVSAKTNVTVGDLTVDRVLKRAQRGSREIPLTAREFALLDYLAAHAGQVVSRDEIIRDVWHLRHNPGTKVIEVYIRYLRRKVDTVGGPSLIETLPGLGNRLAPSASQG
jgi:DNA-binding response OmpR family regulator